MSFVPDITATDITTNPSQQGTDQSGNLQGREITTSIRPTSTAKKVILLILTGGLLLSSGFGLGLGIYFTSLFFSHLTFHGQIFDNRNNTHSASSDFGTHPAEVAPIVILMYLVAGLGAYCLFNKISNMRNYRLLNQEDVQEMTAV